MRKNLIFLLIWLIPFVGNGQSNLELLDKAEQYLKSGKNENDILTDTLFIRIHSLTAFRSLMIKHAVTKNLTSKSVYELGLYAYSTKQKMQ